MRRSIPAGLLSLMLVGISASSALGQGWIVPRPCGIGARPMDERIPNVVDPRLPAQHLAHSKRRAREMTSRCSS